MAYEYDVFISYRRESDSKEWTEDIFFPKFKSYLREELGKKALNIFIDEQGIEGGQYWEDTLKIALAKSKCLVPVLMPSYFQSEWCVREFSVLYHRQEQLVPKPKSLIVPFVIWDGDHFPPPAKALHYFPCHEYYHTGQGFKDSVRYFEFQEKLKKWVVAVAKAIRSAPAWDNNWLDDTWLDLPLDNFLLDDDLSIAQPRNI
jgi:hypothetical protein